MNILRRLKSKKLNKHLLDTSKFIPGSNTIFEYNYRQLDNGFTIIEEKSAPHQNAPFLKLVVLKNKSKSETFNTSGTLWRLTQLWQKKFDILLGPEISKFTMDQEHIYVDIATDSHKIGEVINLLRLFLNIKLDKRDFKEQLARPLTTEKDKFLTTAFGFAGHGLPLDGLDKNFDEFGKQTHIAESHHFIHESIGPNN